MDDTPTELEALRATHTRETVEHEAALHALQTQLLSSERARAELAHALEASEALVGRERAGRQEERSETERWRAEAQRLESDRRERDERERGEQRLKGDSLKALDDALADKQLVQDSLDSLRNLYGSLQSSHTALEAAHADALSLSRASALRLQTLEAHAGALERDKAFLSDELERVRRDARQAAELAARNASELSRSNEARRLELEALKARHDSLVDAHEALSRRHELALAERAALREQLASAQADFTHEAAALKRLVDALERRDAERQKALEHAEHELEALRERASDARVERELERERAAQTIDELETRLEELKAALENAADDHDDNNAEEQMLLSPSAQVLANNNNGSTLKGRTYTDVYAELVRTKDALSAERRESRRLASALDEILQDIQLRAPMLREQRDEHARLAHECALLAGQLADARERHDAAQREARDARRDIERRETEHGLDKLQIRDMGRQIRRLLRVMASRDFAGIDARSSGAREDDEDEEAILRRAEERDDTDAVVSAHLVTFSTVDELQAQNAKLLRITRELGARLEADERDADARRTASEQQALEHAHELVVRLKDELANARLSAEARLKERDMYRRMLAGGGSQPATATATDDEPSDAVARLGTDNNNNNAAAEVQRNFDAYRHEMELDTRRLRDDLTASERTAATLRTELAKANAQREFADERHRLLGEQHAMHVRESEQQHVAYARLQGNMAQQDAALATVQRELFALQSRHDTLANEHANLEHERAVWKRVEERLGAENVALAGERQKLADVLRQLQGMQGDLERSGADARRRLEAQVERLERDVANARERLAKEQDGAKELQLRHELDHKALTDKLDKLTADYQQSREAFVTADTALQHVRAQVSTLEAQVAAQEDKLAVYEGRSGASAADPSLPRERQLELELADVRAELRTTTTELEQARAHVEQFKAIAQASEETLASLSASHDEYRQTMDAALADKESEAASLRARVESLSADLSSSSEQNSQLHMQIQGAKDDAQRELDAVRREVEDLRTAAEVAKEGHRAADSEAQRQRGYARDAHAKYDRELIAHADNVRDLDNLKRKLGDANKSAREAQNAADVARASLIDSTASWERQKAALEHEIASVTRRCDDLVAQNNTLHEHLETVTTRANEVTNAPTVDGGDGDTSVTAPGTGDDQLRDVIRYLRREKEIADLQLELSKQEAARLRQQAEINKRGLDETRELLEQERRQAGEAPLSAAQHAELLEKVKLVNLMRESNDTLREESKRNVRHAEDAEARARSLNEQLVPLQAEVRSLRAEVESKDQRISLIEQDNERWKTRNQQILAKYERIDPEELQTLKETVEKLNADVVDKEQQRMSLAMQLDDQSAALTQAEAARVKWHTNFQNIQTLAKQQREQAKVATKEIEELKHEISKRPAADSAAESSAELETAKAKITELTGEVETLRARITTLETDNSSLTGRLATLEKEKGELVAAKTTLETEKSAIETSSAALKERSDAVFTDNKRMKADAKARAEAAKQLQTELDELKKECETSKASLESSKAELDKAKTELDAAKAELGKVKTDFAAGNADAIERAVEDRLSKMEKPGDSEIEEKVKARVAEVEARLEALREEAVKAAVEAATAPLQKELDALREQLQTKPAEDVDALKAGFEESKRTMQAELDKVKQEAQAKQAEISAQLAVKSESVDVDAIVAERVAAKVKELEAQQEAKVAEEVAKRSTDQASAIQQAVSKALEEAKKAQAEAEEKLRADVDASVRKELSQKASLMQTRVQKLQQENSKLKAELGESKKAASPAASPGPSAAPATPPAAEQEQGAKKTGPALTLRGAARGAGAPNLLAIANAAATGSPGQQAGGKRARDGDSSPQGGSKKPKQGGK